MATVFIATVHDTNEGIDLTDVLFSGSAYVSLEAAKAGAQGYEDECAEIYDGESTVLQWTETGDDVWEAGSAAGNRHMVREVRVLG